MTHQKWMVRIHISAFVCEAYHLEQNCHQTGNST